MLIEQAELENRQTLFSQALREAGLSGAVVFSRGGSTLDRYADVLYLTGFYQSYCYMPETAGLFSGRAHAAFVIDATGRNRLCVAVPEYVPGSVACGGMRFSTNFAECVAAAMSELDVGSGRVGLVGGDVLTYEMSESLSGLLPGLSWKPCDPLLHAIRRIKSPAELALIRRAAALHVEAVSALKDAVAPGRTEAELVAAFCSTAITGGAGIYFSVLSSGSEIDRLCSEPLPGFSTRKIENGDMLRFDTGIVLDGYLSDFGRTFTVGAPSAGQARLMDVLHSSLDEAIAAARPGGRIGDIAAAGEAALARHGVAASSSGPGSIYSSFPIHWGHGLGMGWERPWIVDGSDAPIEAGMYLAIERSLCMDGVGTASAEQTLLVHETGIEILSEGRDGRWH